MRRAGDHFQSGLRRECDGLFGGGFQTRDLVVIPEDWSEFQAETSAS
ncbi:unannotated protein [freshwater metagenome]|uniref:Unannotated protein n=1 Tax=freshwater metagenome TaxID=449393 RepID=A0A6J7AW04_9ZZZZ